MADSDTTDWRSIDTLGGEAVFDVLAKYWEPEMDKFLYQRFCGCVQNDGVILWSHPFWKLHEAPKSDYVNLIEHGFKPVYWMPFPEMPPHE